MQLTQDHDDLRDMMRAFACAMDTHKPDIADMSRRRIAFSQLLRHHLAREDVFVRDLRVSAGAPHVDQVVRAYGDGMRNLFLQYSAHIKAWTLDRMAIEWPAYRTAVLNLQHQLYDRMAWEEQHLHPLRHETRRAA